MINSIFVPKPTGKMKVLGMGNALVDIIARIKNDKMLESLDCPGVV